MSAPKDVEPIRGTREPIRLTRRQLLTAGLALAGSQFVEALDAPQVRTPYMPFTPEQLRTNAGDVGRLRALADAREVEFGSRITNELGQFDLGMLGPDPRKVRRDAAGKPILFQMPPEKMIRDPQTGEVLVDKLPVSDGRVRSNADMFPLSDNRRGIDRLLTSGRALRVEGDDKSGVLIDDTLHGRSLPLDAKGRLTTEGFAQLVEERKRPGAEPIRTINLQVKDLEPAPDPVFSETLQQELADPVVTYIDGQRVNGIIANRDQAGPDKVDNVWINLLGNQTNFDESNMRNGGVAHVMKDKRLISLDPLAEGDSDYFTDEQREALLRGDFGPVADVMLQVLVKHGVKKANFFGGSLGAQYVLAMAAKAKEYGIEVGVVGVYALPINDTDYQAQDQQGKKSLQYNIFKMLYGDPAADIIERNAKELAPIDFYATHPFSAEFARASKVDLEGRERVLNNIRNAKRVFLNDVRLTYAQALAQSTPESTAALAITYLNTQPGGNIYFRSGSNDSLSRRPSLGSAVDLIRDSRGRTPAEDIRVSLQLGPGTEHFDKIQHLDLAWDIERNSRPLAEVA